MRTGLDDINARVQSLESHATSELNYLGADVTRLTDNVQARSDELTTPSPPQPGTQSVHGVCLHW